MDDRKAYIDRNEARMREITAQIELLRARAARANAEARIAYQEQIKSLSGLQEKYGSRIRELRDQGSDAWEGLKEGVESAWSELREGVQKAADAFK